MNTLDNLKKEAKRRLKSLRAASGVADQPTLREVQHALAREQGHESWKAMVARLEHDEHERPPAGLIDAFLEFACWDHHIHGKGDHWRADLAAQRLLAQHPSIARDSLYTAIVCGDIDEVRRRIAENGAGARDSGGPRGWTPLLYLCFTRFSHRATIENAVAIGRLLLDNGADPNDFYMAGSAPYTALVGAAGEGEQDSPRQPWGSAMFELLLERGAKPFDQQVLYNTHFHGDVLWWLELVWKQTKGTALAAAWNDPEWHMLDMGNYGTGARFLLDLAARKHDVRLREWLSAHGANSSTPPRVPLGRKPGPSASMFDAAARDDADAVARLLDAGVPIEIEDDTKQRALHVAAAADAVNVTKLLIAQGADVDARETRFQATPFGFAAHHHHTAVMDLLAPRSRDMFNLCANGYVDRVREVLAESPDRARLVWNAMSLLFWLPEDEEQAIAIADMLRAHGADPRLKNSSGRTAADEAERRGLPALAARLREREARHAGQVSSDAMKLSAFLFDALWAEGVRQIFGIPGDFVLNLYEALEDDGRFRLIRLSHEPAVGFAADGAARISGGLGVCCVTYGAGGLNMINPVACAYAEESPLVVLSGGPGRAEKAADIHVHHEVKTFESQLKVYQEVTDYAVILDDPRTAASHIRKALEVAMKKKRPVYLEIPRDMVGADIDVPDIVDHVELQVDERAVEEAAQEILARLTRAERPVIIVGVEVHRFKLRGQVIALAERLNVPVASSLLGRGVFPTRHPNFIGTYLGVVSPAPLREMVEHADCVVMLGELVSDTGLGVSAGCLSDANLLTAVARDVFVGRHRYEHTPLELVIASLLASPALPRKAMPAHAPSDQLSPEVLERPRDDEPIRVRHVIGVLNEFLASRADTPVVVDTGDCLFAAVDIRANEVVGPGYYATMGFAVPAALGVEIASGRRPLVLVGDGAFQMTGAEISQAPVYGCRPVVVLFNNTRWEMLQAFFPDATYNSTVAWPFAQLAELWGGRGCIVRTPAEFRRALTAAWESDRFSLVEVSLAPGDLSPILRGFVQAFSARLRSARVSSP